MPDPTANEVADKLLLANFGRTTTVVSLTDPIADTPMVVTLNELRPYDLNPRVTRNPRYEDIKSSIRERGLEAPPAITRRPGESTFIIRNGGNTRLAVLHELWAETKAENFFRIPCLFRPWSARGEIVALTGHLVENELRGALSFIERALGIEKARELYEAELPEPLTQAGLAHRLTSDGYPVTQSHISRMQDTVRYLLPAIPTVLYGGLGKPQIEKLATLRRAASRLWERRVLKAPQEMEFSEFFQETLCLFDGDPETFSVQRVQDELLGQLAQLFGADYDDLALELVDTEARHRALTREPVFHVEPTSPATSHALTVARPTSIDGETTFTQSPDSIPLQSLATARNAGRQWDSSRSLERSAQSAPHSTAINAYSDNRRKGHIVSPVDTTDRLQSIQRTIAEATGDTTHDFQDNVVHAIPVQAGGLHPISDVWYIEPSIDAPDHLRIHIGQLALEIASEADLVRRIESIDEGLGFVCVSALSDTAGSVATGFSRAVLSLLSVLSVGYLSAPRANVDAVRLVDDLAPLLQGAWTSRHNASSPLRLSDAGLVKLFRLIRLARRLVELESAVSSPTNQKRDR